MLPNIPDNLSLNEFNLLMHLAAFEFPAYFEEIYVAFIDTQRNKAELLKLLVQLTAKQYVYTQPIINPMIYIDEGLDHVLYALSELGRKTAAAYQPFDKLE